MKRSAWLVLGLAAAAAVSSSDARADFTPSFTPNTAAGQTGASGTSDSKQGGGDDRGIGSDRRGDVTTSGAYARSIPIEVPAFHGIEPKVSLVYDSRQGDGIAGVGWSLAGGSTIAQVSPGRGLPSLTSTDIYTLDGEELVPCQPGTPGPGCALALSLPGRTTFTTRVERGIQIIRDDSGPVQTWMVRYPTGVRWTYGAVSRSSGGKILSWLLTRVEDASGNAVDYEYTPESDPVRYMTRISYNGQAVRLYYELRDDPVVHPFGGGTTGSSRYRLTTIAVGTCGTDDASVGKAYVLSYRLSGATRRTLLGSVRVFGRDARLSPLGVVVNAASASALPPYEFTYQGEASYGDVSYVDGKEVHTKPPPSDLSLDGPALLSGIVKGDTGAPQLAINWHETVSAAIRWQGYKASALGWSRDWRDGDHVVHLGLDWDGDGRDDHAIVTFEDPSETRIRYFLAQPDGTYRTATTSVRHGAIDKHAAAATAADVDGDGRPEIVLVLPDPGGDPAKSFRVAAVQWDTIGAAPSVFGEVSLGGMVTWDASQKKPRAHVLFGDVNGDGRVDVACADGRDDFYTYRVALGHGDGTFGSTLSQVTPYRPSTADEVFLADYDGDGRDDVMLVGSTHVTKDADLESDGKLKAYLARSRSDEALTLATAPFTFTPTVFDAIPASAALRTDDAPYRQWLTADFNGDGRADLVNVSGGLARFFYVDAYGQVWQGADALLPVTYPETKGTDTVVFSMRAEDVNHDGRADLVAYHRNSGGMAAFPAPPFELAIATVLVTGGQAGTWNVAFQEDTRYSRSFFLEASPQCQGAPVPPVGVVVTYCPQPPITSLELADVDGDGQREWVAWSASKVRGLDSDGTTPCNLVETTDSETCDAFEFSFSADVLPVERQVTGPREWLQGDVDGDGRQDFVVPLALAGAPLRVETRLAGPGGYVPNQTPNLLKAPEGIRAPVGRLVDLDGDGRDELVFIARERQPGNQPWGMRIFSLRFRPGSGGDAGAWEALGDYVIGAADATEEMARWHFLDANGDGRTDVAYLVPGTGSATLDVYLSRGDGTFDAVPRQRRSSSSILPTTTTWMVADVNADGAHDLVSMAQDAAGVLQGNTLFSQRDGTYRVVERSQGAPGFGVHPGRLRPADVNGDGITDFVILRSAHDQPSLYLTNTRLRVELLAGAGDGGWNLRLSPLTILEPGSYTNLAEWKLADTNGDGRTDLIGTLASLPPPGQSAGLFGFYAYEATVTYPDLPLFRPRDTWAVAKQAAPYPTTPASWQPVDADGDGWADLTSLDFDRSAKQFYVRTVRQEAGPDLLISSKMPTGGTESVAYQPILGTSPAISYGQPCTLPPQPGQVVRQLVRDAAFGNSGEIERHDYLCPRWSPRERAFLGWSQATVTELPVYPAKCGADPCFPNRPEVERRTTYALSDACGAQPTAEMVYEYTPTLLLPRESSTTDYVDPHPNAPFDCAVASMARIVHDAAGVPALRTRTDLRYDAFHEPEWRIDLGDLDADGDERARHTVRAALSEPYLVTEASEELFAWDAAAGKEGARLRAVHHCYDAAVTFDDADRSKARKVSGCAAAASRGLRAASLACTDVTKCETSVGVDHDITGGLWLVDTFEYDAQGNRTAATDTRGGRTTTEYVNPYPTPVLPTKITNAAGHETKRGWDWLLALPLTTEDPNGVTVATTYDPLGRATHQETRFTDAGGTSVTTNVTDWTRSSEGTPGGQMLEESAFDGALKVWTRTYYDGFGRAVRVARRGSPDSGGTPQDAERSLSYTDASPRQYQASTWVALGGKPTLFTTSSYDYGGRVVRAARPDGAVATTSYGVDSPAQRDAPDDRPYRYLIATVTDERGGVQATVTDVRGAKVRVDQSQGGAMAALIFGVDLVGERVRVVDPSKNETDYLRNSLGWLMEEADPDRGKTVYTRDLGGNEIQAIRADKTQVRTTYDALGRPSARVYARSTGETRTLTYTYDAADAAHGAGRGRLTSVSDSSVLPCTDGAGHATLPAVSYAYEPRGGIVSTTKCTGGDFAVTIGASYDALGRLAATIYPDGEEVDYAYDEGGRLRSVKNTKDGVTYVERMGYTLDGDLGAVALGNGATETFTYTPERRFLQKASIQGKGGASIYGAAYHYYPDGLVKDETVTGGRSSSRAFAYDAQDRLVQVTGSSPESFAFDPIGNLVQVSKTVLTPFPSGPGKPHVHAIASAGAGTSFTYDDAGFLTSETVGGVTRTFAWNELGLLASVAFSGQTTSFVYDATLARIQKKTAGGTLYSFSPFYEVDEKGGSRTPVKQYFAGPRFVAHREGKGVAGALTFHHQDRLGSVVALSDDKGAPVTGSAYQYSAYGVSLDVPAKASPEIARGFQFTGQRQDAETSPDPGAGLVYLTARFFDPALGRFPSPDAVVPQETIMGYSRYAYASGNPISRIDPGGNADQDAQLQCVYSAPVAPPNQSVNVSPGPLTPEESAAVDAAIKQQQARGSYKGVQRRGDFFDKITPDYLSVQFAFGSFVVGFTSTRDQAFVNFNFNTGVGSVLSLANGVEAARQATGGLSSLSAYGAGRLGISFAAGRLLNDAPTRENLLNFLGGSGQGIALGALNGGLSYQRSGNLSATEVGFSASPISGIGAPFTVDGGLGYTVKVRDTGAARAVPVDLVYSSGATVPAFVLDEKSTNDFLTRKDIEAIFH